CAARSLAGSSWLVRRLRPCSAAPALHGLSSVLHMGDQGFCCGVNRAVPFDAAIGLNSEHESRRIGFIESNSDFVPLLSQCLTPANTCNFCIGGNDHRDLFCPVWSV